jgi:hypothetical protein
LKACRFQESASLIASLNALRFSGVSFGVTLQYLLRSGHFYHKKDAELVVELWDPTGFISITLIIPQVGIIGKNSGIE